MFDMMKMPKHYYDELKVAVGKEVADLYSQWYDAYGEKLTYEWLADNGYELEVVLEEQYQHFLMMHMKLKFIEWIKGNI
jgi:hypothetical protein